MITLSDQLAISQNLTQKNPSSTARGDRFSRQCRYGRLLWRISAAVGRFIC